jgi:hypothetical protein
VPKKLIKRYLPDHQTLRTHRHLQVFGARLHDPNLWHLNRRSASGAFAVGLFVAFIPLPLQMLLAAALAIVTQVNLPVSVALVWITNPVTMPPIFYFCYRVGGMDPERTRACPQLRAFGGVAPVGTCLHLAALPSGASFDRASKRVTWLLHRAGFVAPEPGKPPSTPKTDARRTGIVGWYRRPR